MENTLVFYLFFLFLMKRITEKGGRLCQRNNGPVSSFVLRTANGSRKRKGKGQRVSFRNFFRSRKTRFERGREQRLRRLDSDGDETTVGDEERQRKRKRKGKGAGKKVRIDRVDHFRDGSALRSEKARGGASLSRRSRRFAGKEKEEKGKGYRA